LKALAALSAGLAALVLVAGCGSGRSASQIPASRTNLQSIFEDETLLHASPVQTLDALRRLGVDRVRVYLAWESFAPDPSSRARPAHFDASDPAAYAAASWSIYDTIVRDAAARGIALDFTVGGPAPLWATGSDVPHPGPPQPVWKVSARDYGAFVRAVATRYSGRYKPVGTSSPLPRVSFWSIWNEPNYGADLAPQAIDHSTVEVSPRLYRGLLDAAWTGLAAAGHSGDTILIGETAPRGQTVGNHPGNFDGMVPLRFVRALYCVDGSFRPLRGEPAAARGCPTDTTASQQFARLHPGLFHASGFADHPYPQGGVPPNVANPSEPDYADLPSLPNLERTLDNALAAYGSNTRLPIYSTEFGYQTDPPETIAHTTSPEIAAGYLNWSEYISWRDPRVRSYDQYQLADPPSGNFATGLEFSNGTPKATYDAYRMPLYVPVTPTRRGQSVEVWGCVRPAHYARLNTRAPQRVLIQFQTGSRGRFQTLQSVTIADPQCYFDTHLVFAHSGVLRLAWTYPHGATIHSRALRISVH
jgi:hypothetical protein